MKIGLVLSGGGARGFAHIGVLKVLEEHNIQISEIAGCSMGALIGAMYASGMSIKELEQFVLKTKAISFRDISFSFRGIFKADRIEKEIEKNLKVKTFEELKIPLSINAVDINTGKEVVFRKGELIKAIRASFSIPGVVIPAKHKGRILIDGSVVNPLPSSHLKKVDVAIMVNVTTRTAEIKTKSRIDQIAKQTLAIREMHLIDMEVESFKKPYIMIKPNVADYEELNFKKANEIILKGEKAARESINNILKMTKTPKTGKKPSFISEIFRKIFRKV